MPAGCSICGTASGACGRSHLTKHVIGERPASAPASSESVPRQREVNLIVAGDVVRMLLPEPESKP